MSAMLDKIAKHYRQGTLWRVGARRIRGPFQARPYNATATDTSYTYSHLHKGEQYHTWFDELPGRRLIWELEQDVLHSLARERGPFGTHLDFAGGTGRIAGALESHCSTQFVLDVSESMLAVAEKHLTKAVLLQRDFSQGVPELNDHSVDLATAFRFFPNAEPALRAETMKFLAGKIRKGGWLVCNNHRNFWSVPYFFARLTFQGGEYGMTNHEMITLAKTYGFSLLRSYSVGVVPQGDRRAILPWSIVAPIERSIFQRVGASHHLGYNVIFVFERG